MQWLCYASRKDHFPRKRLTVFFRQLYGVLKRGARAIIQLYPETPQQMELITNCAMSCGFTGGLVVDYPNSAKAKKFYLCLFAGTPEALPKGLSDRAGFSIGSAPPKTEVAYEDSRRNFKKNKKRHRRNEGRKTLKEKILSKKDRQRRQGKTVRPDTKYTGRKRSGRF